MIAKRILRIAMLLIGFMSVVPAATADDVEIKATQLTRQIYMITGKGGNLGVFIGDDGTFLIDDQFAPLTQKILETVKSVGGDTPKFLINTHYHGDHTGGNENLGKSGTLIFSHHNVRQRLATGSYIAAFKVKREALPKEGLPVVTFSDDINFHLNGERVHAIHVPHAHTDGDSFIYFEKANVIHAGDLFFNGIYPFIDVSHGGSLKGMITGVDKVLALTDDNTKIIAGHGPLGDKAQLQSYKKMLTTAHHRLQKLKAAGKTAQEAIAAKPLADLEPTWGKGMFNSDRWIEIIYSGV